MGINGLQQALDLLRREQTGRAATEKDRADL